MRTDAYLSDNRKYRYWLLRVWDDSLPINCSCGVNPSTADERENDPTIRKDIGFSERQGFGGLLKLNVSAFRCTDPKGMRHQPIGEFNTPSHLRQYFDLFQCKQFTAAWGKNGNYLQRHVAAVIAEFPEAMCFGKNPDGTPRHTLMLPYTTTLEKLVSKEGATNVREITDHIVPGDSANHQMKIEVLDGPGQGGACHHYKVTGFNTKSNSSDPFVERHGAPAEHSTVLFQNGPIKDVGVNGITHEALLAIVMDRMRSFQAGPFACQANAEALAFCDAALKQLQMRTVERIARGVEGTHAA